MLHTAEQGVRHLMHMQVGKVDGVRGVEGVQDEIWGLSLDELIMLVSLPKSGPVSEIGYRRMSWLTPK